MAEPTRTQLRRMRKRVEEMLIEGHRGTRVIELLEDLAGAADEGSEMALFAHRQLAELRLEGSPWKAALHLRRLRMAGVADDGVHALLGLCHALMGNFRAAVSAYRSALRNAPNNPWYHHNLGHLLDVGLARPQAALPHLAKAHELGPREDEVTASLAHCLARLDRLADARRLARQAVERAPENPEHRALLQWIEQGAPSSAHPAAPGEQEGAASSGGMPSGWPRSRAGLYGLRGLGTPRAEQFGRVDDAGSQEPLEFEIAEGEADRVAALLAERMSTRGCSRDQLACAKAVWRDYREVCRPRVGKPEVFAAAIEYATAKLAGESGITQVALAARYGVGSRAISQRYGEIRDGLGLVPHDPRYGL